ncbi:hypothetical protein CEXT_574821 [Caerostris extrusa]|uniref:Pre-C2HC domain-containing protein n=1 Tax=Caerostris extrusa TaxID=172846 RepID=A0AAV4Y686_CAEEX|nr:hypothetical protein CEXT_574821 [Caerostris extrusa]
MLSPANSHASIRATFRKLIMTLQLPPFVACVQISNLDAEKKMQEETIAEHLQAIADSQQELEKIAERVRLLGPCPIDNCRQHSQSTEIDHNFTEDFILPSERLTVKCDSTVSLDKPESPIETSNSFQELENVEENIEIIPELPSEIDNNSTEDFIFPSKRLTVKSESTISLDRPESPIETSNSFQELEKVEENIEMIPDLPTPKLHPLMVWRDNLDTQFLKEIREAFNDDLKISLSGDYFKIFPTDFDHHTKICQYLSNSKINFFINTPKHLRVVIKGLHVNTPNSEIEEELTQLGFEIKSTDVIPVLYQEKLIKCYIKKGVRNSCTTNSHCARPTRHSLCTVTVAVCLPVCVSM